MTYQTSPACTSCSGKAQPGTVATLVYLIARFPGTSSLGVYNCRLPSDHSCGRAFDLRIPTLSNGRANNAIGDPIVRFLYENSTFLGLTYQIYDRVIYTPTSPGGREYGGVHPHYDHIHGSQTMSKALSLSMSQLIAQLGPIPIAPPKPPTPKPPTDWTKALIMSLPTLQKDTNYGKYTATKKKQVGKLQALLAVEGHVSSKTFDKNHKPDGLFGPGTETAVKAFQKKKKLKVDGIVGQNTWTKLLV